MLVEVLILELVRLLLEEWADGEGDGREVVQPRSQVRLAGRPAGPLVLPVQAAPPADGILGYQFDSKTQVFCFMLFTIFLLVDLKKKPDSNLVYKYIQKNPRNPENLGLLLNTIL